MPGASGSQGPKSPQNKGVLKGKKGPDNPQKGLNGPSDLNRPVLMDNGGSVRLPPEGSSTLDITPIDAEWIETQGQQSQEVLKDLKAPKAPEPPGPPAPPKLPCSFFSCASGHLWPPQGGLVQCPGCGGPVLTLRMSNCPRCNEPAERWVIRTERVGVGPGQPPAIPARCCGQDGPGEPQFVEFKQVEETRPENQEATK